MNTLIAKTSIQAKSSKILNDLIVDAIQDIKGKKIVKLDLRKIKDAPADYFIVCEGDSITQVKAIASSVERKVKTQLGMNPNHTEGVRSSQWVLVDYFDTIVHVFYPEARKYYDIEDLWIDADYHAYKDL